MGKIIRLFGVDIDVSIAADDEETQEMEMELDMRLGRKKRCCIKREDDMEAEEEPEPPVIPSGLLQLIESSRQGTIEAPPVFLYQKRLTGSDLNKQESRLFVTTKGRKRFNEFLSKEDRETVNGLATKGLRDIVGIDAQGESYNLGLNFWPSMKIMVINSEWYKLANQNTAGEGDWVQIWGYKGCLAINFNKGA